MMMMMMMMMMMRCQQWQVILIVLIVRMKVYPMMKSLIGTSSSQVESFSW
jgi:hypothetical protein